MSENIWFTLSAMLNLVQLLMYFFITTFWRECGRRWKRDNKENQACIKELKEALKNMHFAYQNKDGENPHQFETDAINEYESLKKEPANEKD